MKTEKDETNFWPWVKAHKKQLAIAGISLAALAAFVLGLKNKDAIMELWVTLEKSIRKVPADSSVLGFSSRRGCQQFHSFGSKIHLHILLIK